MLQRGKPWGRLVALIVIVQLLVVQGGVPNDHQAGGYDIKDSGPKLHQFIKSYFNNNIYIYGIIYNNLYNIYIY